MDPDLLDQALGELRRAGTPAAAVVPVDLLGKAADYSRIGPICKAHDVPLFCDAAESLGACHAGRPAGSFGRASVFSFNGNKIMTTSGGGMFVTDDEKLAHHVRYLSTQARQPVVHYEHTDIGYNYRMSNLLAALGRAQLSRLDEMIRQRRLWRDQYREFFASVPGIEVFGGANDEEDNFWLSSIIVDPVQSQTTAQKIQRILDANDIESRPMWKPMHLQPVFQGAPRMVNGSSEWLFANGLTLPSGSGMSDRDFAKVLSVLSEAAGR
jgi:dTDP-4-amino-4,6-dideoxygalactose transaminase